MDQRDINDLLFRKGLSFSDWWVATFQNKNRLTEISKEDLAECAWNAALQSDMLIRHPEIPEHKEAAQGIAKSSVQQQAGQNAPTYLCPECKEQWELAHFAPSAPTI